ncbi:hypothetical protein Tco_0631121, partial [Tanacetum coccineum]
TSGNRTVSLSNSFDALNDDSSVPREVELGSKASTSMHMEGLTYTPIVEKISRIEKHLIEGKCVLVDDDGKPLKNFVSFGDHDSDNEVEPVDNEMANYLASNPSGVGFGTKSLLEQWNDSYEDADYDYDPYDNDMYKG